MRRRIFFAALDLAEENRRDSGMLSQLPTRETLPMSVTTEYVAPCLQNRSFLVASVEHPFTLGDSPDCRAEDLDCVMIGRTGAET
jgi:hypothetical protein